MGERRMFSAGQKVAITVREDGGTVVTHYGEVWDYEDGLLSVRNPFHQIVVYNVKSRDVIKVEIMGRQSV